MTVTSGYFSCFRPESYLPRFAYFPLFFKEVPETLTLNDVKIEADDTGKFSIIRLIDKEDKRIVPFINLSKYDSETKSWFIYHSEESTNYTLPYRLAGTTVTNMYPSTIGTLDDFVISSTSVDIDKIKITGIAGGESYDFYKYAPIILIAENVPFNDLTDYTNITAAKGSLLLTSPTYEFYYDFEDRIFTNLNLAGFDAKNVKLIFSRIGNNSVTLKCSMASNVGSKPKQTPVVNDYVLKLKGQYLRG